MVFVVKRILVDHALLTVKLIDFRERILKCNTFLSEQTSQFYDIYFVTTFFYLNSKVKNIINQEEQKLHTYFMSF